MGLSPRITARKGCISFGFGCPGCGLIGVGIIAVIVVGIVHLITMLM